MSKGINKVILVGNCTKDAETRYMPSGKAVTNFTVATSEFWKDRDSGERKERTEFHRCVAFDKLAEIIGQYLKNGSKVYIEGALRTRSYDKDGQKHYTTEIVVNEMQMLDGRGGQQADHSQGFDQPHQGRAGGYAERPAAAATPQSRAAAPAADFDDDIPF